MTTDTSPDRIEAVGLAIFGAVTAANPEAFHPTYEHDREVWDDAAKSAMGALTQPSLNRIERWERALCEADGFDPDTYYKGEGRGKAYRAIAREAIALSEAEAAFLTLPSASMAEYEKLRGYVERMVQMLTTIEVEEAEDHEQWAEAARKELNKDRAALDAFVSRLIALAEAGRVAQEKADA